MPVLVSGIVRWRSEFRCFIRERALQRFSIYSRAGELQKDADFACAEDERAGAHAFVQQLLGDKRVELPAATVVDVGVIEGQGWAMVEQNAAWGAGLYGCDPFAALETLARACVKRIPRV